MTPTRVSGSALDSSRLPAVAPHSASPGADWKSCSLLAAVLAADDLMGTARDGVAGEGGGVVVTVVVVVAAGGGDDRVNDNDWRHEAENERDRAPPPPGLEMFEMASWPSSLLPCGNGSSS
jgi:hypothetical protein